MLRFGLFVASILFVSPLASPTQAEPPGRNDLARAYLRFDRLAAESEATTAVRRRLNARFDALTADFFAGRSGRVIVALARAEAEQRGLGARETDELLFALTRRLDLDAECFDPSSTKALRIGAQVQTFDEAPAGVEPSAIYAKSGQLRIEVPYAARVTLEWAGDAADRVIEVGFRFEGLGDVELARLPALETSPDLLKQSFMQRIEAAAAVGGVAPSVLSSLRARCALLGARAGDGNAYALFVDRAELAQELERDLTALEAGQDPFRSTKDVWRTFKALGVELPTRVFVPEGEGPFPLLVAFHGAGGDEHMFFEAYGAGALRRLAERFGIALVAPPTVPFGLSPALFDRFVDEVAQDPRIDGARIMLLGHSLGAVTCSRLAALRPDRVAAAAAIAGFADAGRGAAAPRLVCIAELDPIFRADGLDAAVDAARARGCEIEVVRFPDEGHTLVVGAALPQAVDWLLARRARSTDAANPAASTPSTRPMKTGVPASSENAASPSAGPTK
ncbi:MAG: hypothetical protein RL136_110 [Planctomycetota bacterium]|jgi:dienelactone hydrolase